MAFVGEPVERIRREQTGTDRYGNPVYSETRTLLAERAAFDPGGSREPVEIGRDQVITNPKLYFLGARPDVNSTDRLVVRGEEFSVQGDPADWRSPWGTDLGGMVVELERVEG